MDPLLKFFIDRVHRAYFSNFPLFYTPQHQYIGVFMKHRLSTYFEADLNDSLVAQLVCETPTGQTIPLEALQRLCRASQSAVVLDRFTRAIHLLNLMAEPAPGRTVYLPVTQALIDGVEKDHGQVFRAILTRLELDQQSFGILLPATLRKNPQQFDRVTQAYQRNGFLTAEYRTQQSIGVPHSSPSDLLQI